MRITAPARERIAEFASHLRSQDGRLCLNAALLALAACEHGTVETREIAKEIGCTTQAVWHNAQTLRARGHLILHDHAAGREAYAIAVSPTAKLKRHYNRI